MSLTSDFSFDVRAEDPSTLARTGVLKTPNGDIQTPAMVFCATRGAFRGLTMEQVRQAGAQIVLSNTYHLLVRPGTETVAKLGGLHKFADWSGPTMTDSGGFQIFSLQHGGVADEIKGRPRPHLKQTLNKITEEGARFASYHDGSPIMLTPEESIRAQRQIGADLIYVLDECTPFHASKSYTAAAMYRSQRWGLRCIEEYERTVSSTGKQQALYGIVQGGVYPELRAESVAFTNSNRFFGNAVGGSLGQTRAEMVRVVRETTSQLRRDRPTHLLGIGGIQDIWNNVAAGIDTFDCVHPVRIARHGSALRIPPEPGQREHINLKNARYKGDDNPISADCDCYCCKNFSRGYLHYLVQAGELLAATLLAIHNVRFIVRLMQHIRDSIVQGNFHQEYSPWAT